MDVLLSLRDASQRHRRLRLIGRDPAGDISVVTLSKTMPLQSTHLKHLTPLVGRFPVYSDSNGSPFLLLSRCPKGEKKILCLGKHQDAAERRRRPAHPSHVVEGGGRAERWKEEGGGDEGRGGGGRGDGGGGKRERGRACVSLTPFPPSLLLPDSHISRKLSINPLIHLALGG